MIPGIFESVFPRESLDASFAALKSAGFSAVQFDLESAGLDPWAGELDVDVLDGVRESATRNGVEIASLSGTFNMAHPDVNQREAGLTGLVRAIGAAPTLGTSMVTLCTGTRNRESIWRFSHENATPQAWSDMREMVTRALAEAEKHNVTLLVEPEPANVVASAKLARRLLDEVASPHLKIVLDPANVVLSDRDRSPAEVLSESFALLGPDIVAAHAKDLGEGGDFRAAGTGIVPWPLYLDLLKGIGYEGAVIFHTLTEQDVPTALGALPL